MKRQDRSKKAASNDMIRRIKYRDTTAENDKIRLKQQRSRSYFHTPRAALFNRRVHPTMSDRISTVEQCRNMGKIFLFFR